MPANSAVALIGPRQAGKTTLAHAIARTTDALYLDLESRGDRSNTCKRLVKSPKVYVRDSGLVHALLGIEDLNALSGHPVVGPSWEGFVIENLLAASPARTMPGFYRTSTGAEIDLVLALPGKHGLWAIEIKRGLTAAPSRGFHVARADIKPRRSFIVYSGEERFSVSEGVEAIGVRRMAAQLSEL